MEKEKKKMGRPITKFRDKRMQLKLSEEELEIIKECSEILKKSRVDVIVESVKEKYQKIKK